jgi:hypothetical protein
MFDLPCFVIDEKIFEMPGIAVESMNQVAQNLSHAPQARVAGSVGALLLPTVVG